MLAVSAGTENLGNVQAQLQDKGLHWKRTTEVCLGGVTLLCSRRVSRFALKIVAAVRCAACPVHFARGGVAPHRNAKISAAIVSRGVGNL